MSYLASLSPQDILSLFTLAGLLAVSVATWRTSKRSAASADESDALTALQIKDNSIDTLTKELARVNDVVIEQGKQIAGMQAQIKAKDELIERYLQLLQNRNPEIDIFMKNTSEALTTLTKLMQSLLEGQEKILAKPTVSINNQPTA